MQNSMAIGTDCITFVYFILNRLIRPPTFYHIWYSMDFCIRIFMMEFYDSKIIISALTTYACFFEFLILFFNYLFSLILLQYFTIRTILAVIYLVANFSCNLVAS